MKGSFEELQELLFVEPLPKHIKEQNTGKFTEIGMSYKLKKNVCLDPLENLGFWYELQSSLQLILSGSKVELVLKHIRFETMKTIMLCYIN